MQSQLTIADYFKWDLDKVKELSYYDVKMIQKYFKKIESMNKKAQRRIKGR